MTKILKFIIAAFLFITVNSLHAQEKVVIDEILAILGNQIILKSDIERQMIEYKFMDTNALKEGKCEIFNNMILQKLLLNQAQLDSLKVSDEQVNSEIGSRLKYYISQVGSVEKLETYYNKKITEIKDEMREPIREVLLVRQMKEKILSKQQVSPKEILDFFKQIPPDSLPFYNTEVEIAQIAIFPKPTKEEEQRARNKITELRDRILKGENFENLAILYTEDESTATKGGDLGMRSKMEFVPEFAYAAMRLKKDSISDVIKTKFGFHIIQMIDRKGEQIQVRHILIKPQLNNEARNQAIDQLTNILVKIKSDSFTLSQAAYKFSEDENTKNSGGMMINPETGSSRIPLDKLDATLFFLIDTMKVGHYSKPVKFVSEDGRTGYRIVYLKSKTFPHKANLTDDYSKISQMAENFKSVEILQKWVNKTIANTYLQVKEPYNECENIKSYIQLNQSKP